MRVRRGSVATSSRPREGTVAALDVGERAPGRGRATQARRGSGDVAADLVAVAGLDDELPVDDTLASCVQLSLSTPRAASPTVVESGLVVHASDRRICHHA
jgi:hypothetical protein